MFCRGGEGVESEIESIGLLIAVTWLPLRFLVNLGGRERASLSRSKEEELLLSLKKGYRKSSLFLIVTRALEPLHFYWLVVMSQRSNLRGPPATEKILH